MVKLLETSLPQIPEVYDRNLMSRLVHTVEGALTRVDLPSVISGEDDTNGINWFMN